MSVEIDEGIARRVLEVVDAGLVAGLGKPVPGQMCVEAAVCYALGLPHGDDPPCVSPAVRRLTIRLNDSRWSSPQTRASGMRRLAIAALGSAGALDEGEFARRVARLAIQMCVPTALRAAAQCCAGEQRERLLHAADLCERKPTRKNALEARATAYACTSAYAFAAHAAAHATYAAAYGDAAYAAACADAAAAAAADAAYAVVVAAAGAFYAAEAADEADEAAYAIDAAAAGASYAAEAADEADEAAYAIDAAAAGASYAAEAADEADEAAYAASYADAAGAAAAAADTYYAIDAADADDAADMHLSDFAEGVVQILRDMGSPGCAFLHLTESA